VDLPDPNDNNTALMTASVKGHITVVKLLLDHGADVNSRDKRGNTPLHRSIMSKKSFIVPVLLAAGADPNAADIFGETPVHAAALRGQTGILKKLVRAGGDIYMTDRSDPQRRNAIQLLRDFCPRKAKLADDVEKLYKKKYGSRLRQEDSPKTARTNFEFEI